MANSHKVKHLKNNTCRVVKIDKEALFEFVYETMIERLEQYFDLLDSTTVVSHHKFSEDTGDYICIINDENVQLPNDIDVDVLITKMEATTNTLYANNRYKEMTFDEVRRILYSPKE